MQKLTHQIYTFDEFTLDVTRGSLVRNGSEIKLRPKSFEVLKFLVENGGRLITKDEIIRVVWQGMAVTDDSLVQCLKDIRRALNDKSQAFVKTVQGRGYIFEKEVRENGAAAQIYTEETEGVHLVIEETIEERGDVETREHGDERLLPASQHRRVSVSVLIIAAATVLLGGLAYGLFVFFRQPAAPPFRSVSIKRLTTDGKAQTAAISPDGNYVAFVINDNGQKSLWVRQVATLNPRQIAPPDKEGYGRLVFSPDSSFVYYVQADTLYQVPVLGGAARKTLEGVNRAITFSPDGKRLAFVRVGQGEQSLILANADGSGEEQTLTVRKLPEFLILPVLGNTGLAWSPDGKMIACPGGDGGGFGQAYPIAVSVTDGTQKPLTTKRWNAIVQMAWLADGSGLLMNAKDNGIDATRQIWHVSYPNGVPQRIYNDFNEYDTLSLSANSGLLVSVQREVDSNIWSIGSQDEPTRAKQITFGTGRQDGYWGMDTTPDGKIVADLNVDGERDLWMMDEDGGNQKRLTFDPLMEAFVRVSPDGRQILFHLGGKGLWKMNLDGGNRKQLTDGGMFPHYSPDGNWILYTLPREKWSLWKISSDGGESVRLTDHPAFHPAISPDGKLIAYHTRSPNQEHSIRIIPFEGGEPLKVFAMMQQPIGHLEWTSDGKAITYKMVNNGIEQIVNQLLDGGPPQVLVSAKSESESIRGFAWSRDGKRLFFKAGPVSSNVVMFDLKR